MRQFLKDNPYIVIYTIVIVFATLIFGWGKLFTGNGLEWYLDKVNMIIAGIVSILGLALFSALWYFRHSSEKEAGKE
jgi:formate hydrogenlyase subunit 3/multisubunit Na+/H+ antiporter MnhD subunit